MLPRSTEKEILVAAWPPASSSPLPPLPRVSTRLALCLALFTSVPSPGTDAAVCCQVPLPHASPLEYPNSSSAWGEELLLGVPDAALLTSRLGLLSHL